MSNRQSEHTRMVRRGKKRKVRKRILLILAPFLIAFAVFLTYGAHLYIKAGTVFSNSHEDDGREKSELRDEKVDPGKDNVSILIVGVDQSEVRGNEGFALSDTLILATLNKENKSVHLLSIPRDSYVNIPGKGYDKITHAHGFGGTSLAVETVENLLDVPVDYSVKLNFDAFIEVVEAVDGITIDVPYELYEQDSKDVKNAIHLLPGEQELNGEEALALARTRKYDNDIERGKRQQDIIKAVFKKSLSLGSILKYDNIMEAVGSNMTTSMEFDEIKSFISYGMAGSDLEFETHSLEGYDYQPGDTYYWKLDEDALEETKQMLKEQLELDN